MLEKKDLEKIVQLKQQYEAAQQSFNKGDFDQKIKTLEEFGKREIIKNILKEDDYKALAQFHNKTYSSPNGPDFTINIIELAIKPNPRAKKAEELIDVIKRAYNVAPIRTMFSNVTNDTIRDFMLRVDTDFLHFEDPKIEQIENEQDQLGLALNKAHSDYYDAVHNALVHIEETVLEEDRVNQLLIQDSQTGNTIGHICLQKNQQALQDRYIRILFQLNSPNLRKVLLLYNYQRPCFSILHAYVQKKPDFLTLAARLEPDDLYALLMVGDFFIDILKICDNRASQLVITEGHIRFGAIRLSSGFILDVPNFLVSSFLRDYWALLKNKFLSTNEGRE